MSMQFIEALQKKGIGKFQDGNGVAEAKLKSVLFGDALPTLTPNNIGVPSNLLTQTMTKSLEIITQKRTSEEVFGGKAKIMDWQMQKGQFPIKERTAMVDTYSDFGDAKYAGLNVNWEDVRNHRFSAGILIGDLEVEQYAEAKINYVNEVNTAAAESIAIEFNRIAFNGYIKDGNYVVHGGLTSPLLKPYETIAKTWDTATFEEIKADITKLLGILTEQSGGNVNVAKDKIRVSIPSTKLVWLKTTVNQLSSKFLLTMINEAFPNIEWIGAPELTNAYNTNKDVLYMVAENNIGGVSETCELGFSELMRMSRLEQKTTSYVQKMSAGSNGFIPYKPTYIVRAQGI